MNLARTSLTLPFVLSAFACVPVTAQTSGSLALPQQAAALVTAYNAKDRQQLAAFFTDRMTTSALQEESADQRAAGLLNARNQSGTIAFVQPPAQNDHGGVLDLLVRPEHGHVARLVLLGSHRQPGKISDVLLMPAADPAAVRALPATQSGSKSVAPDVDRYLSSLAADGVFSGSVRISDGGKVLFEGAYGYANRQTGARNTPQTRFHIASMGKMFTAVAIGQLIERGKLRFDETLAEALPDYPNRDAAQKITIEQLLGHRSGLGDVFGISGNDHRALTTLADVIPLIAEKPLNFAPGSAFGYSNAGYVTLGAIIERVSGESFQTYLHDHIFTPAGIAGDPFHHAHDEANVAIGYSFADDPFRLNAPASNASFFKRIGATGIPSSPAGGEYLTARDVDRFFATLEAGKYIKPETLARLTNAQADAAQGPERTYAYGFEVYHLGDATIVGHTGGGAGSGVDSTGGTNGHIIITVLTNGDPPTGINAFELLWRYVLAR